MGLPTEIMTPEEFKVKMEALKGKPDNYGFLGIDEAHGEMDEAMCELLIDLGYGDGIEIFRQQEKFYS